jgi:hypothetical protein
MLPEATTANVAVCPAVTVWFAGCTVMERRVGWGLPLDVFEEFEEAQPAKDRPRHRVTNRSLAGNAKGVRVTERSKTTIGFAGLGPAGPGLERVPREQARFHLGERAVQGP